MKALGIDPGVTGGLAVVSRDADGSFTLETARIMDVATDRSKPRVDPGATLRWLRQTLSMDVDFVVIENVHSMPKQGVSSSFQFGRMFGGVEAIAQTLDALYDSRTIPVIYVEPGTWKPALGLTGATKKRSKDVATAVFGAATGELYWPLAKHDGIAEAALIACYQLTKEAQ